MRLVRCVRVIDGDTIEVETEERARLKIRLYGIDAPEFAQPYGDAATQALAQMLYEHPLLYLQQHGTSYDRVLGSLYVDERIDEIDGRDNNICYQMVRQGWAWCYIKKTPKGKRRRSWGIPRPPLDVFLQAEALARSEGLGLWQQAYGGQALRPHTFRHMDKKKRRRFIDEWLNTPAYNTPERRRINRIRHEHV